MQLHTNATCTYAHTCVCVRLLECTMRHTHAYTVHTYVAWRGYLPLWSVCVFAYIYIYICRYFINDTHRRYKQMIYIINGLRFSSGVQIRAHTQTHISCRRNKSNCLNLITQRVGCNVSLYLNRIWNEINKFYS